MPLFSPKGGFLTTLSVWRRSDLDFSLIALANISKMSAEERRKKSDSPVGRKENHQKTEPAQAAADIERSRNLPGSSEVNPMVQMIRKRKIVEQISDETLGRGFRASSVQDSKRSRRVDVGKIRPPKNLLYLDLDTLVHPDASSVSFKLY